VGHHPPGTPPPPGAQLSLVEERDGWRYTAFLTNTQVGTRIGWWPAAAHTPASKIASAAKAHSKVVAGLAFAVLLDQTGRLL